MKAGERAQAMARAYNVREGLTAADDVLPPRMAEPIESTAIDGWRIDPNDFLLARSLYYGMMGWDEETGVPKAWKLHELGIGWAADLLDEV
jgi:aldehyde:ferredoxin oxidoreductase